MNASTNPYDIGAQQSISILNMILSEHGSAQTRDGTALQTLSPDAPSGAILSVGIEPGHAGSFYNVGDTYAILGGSVLAVVQIDAVNLIGAVTALHLLSAGSGYVTTPGASTIPSKPNPGTGNGLLRVSILSVTGPTRPIVKLFDFVLGATGGGGSGSGGGGGGGGGTGIQPVVSIQSPADGSTLPEGSVSVTMTATAIPAAGLTIASVTFFVNASAFAVVTSAPYHAVLDVTGFEAGSPLTLSITALDSAGNTASASVTVTIGSPSGGGGAP